MAGVIKTKAALDTEIGEAITEGGIPAPVDSTDHKILLENINESQVVRNTAFNENNLASGSIDFTVAGSRGLHIFNLVNNNYKITGFVNTVQGDEILLQINGDFDFSFDDTQFTEDNSRIVGDYEKSADYPTFIRVRCARDNALDDFFLIEFLNEEALIKVRDAFSIFDETFEDEAIVLNEPDQFSYSFTATADTEINISAVYDLAASGGGLNFDLDFDQQFSDNLVIARELVVNRTGSIAAATTETFKDTFPTFILKNGETVTVYMGTNANGSGGGTFENVHFRVSTEIVGVIRPGS